MKTIRRTSLRILRSVLALTVIASSAGCGTEPSVPATITISPDSAALLEHRETVQLAATVRDPDGLIIPGLTVIWASGDQSVATVDINTGLVTAVGNGVASVRATGYGLTASATVTVDLQRDALLKIFDATGGSGWREKTNWGTVQPLGSWYGVTTNAAGNVVELWLPSNGLVGYLPPELGNLRHLRHLRLTSNALTGPIPPELGNLQYLSGLSLSYNELMGQIPPELGNLRHLRHLSLSANELTGQIPPELGNLQNLWYLSLSYNELTGQIPPELGNLQNLQELYLTSNALTGQIPPELGSLQDLRYLYLTSNALSGPIPPELGNLLRLRFLLLSSNELTGQIPSRLFTGLWDLRILMLHSNQLSGPLPATLIGKRLHTFLWDHTDLCAPSDEAFQEWLSSIHVHRGGRNCE